MSLPYCTRCQSPLPAGSDAGLCPDCLRTSTRTATPRPPAGSDDGTETASGEARVAELPLPPHFLSTPSGAEGTLTPLPGSSTDAPVGQLAPHLPAAPPGYDLIRPLGEGGMGSVYLARERAAERTVAIKFLHAPGRPTAYDRFLVEVRALARLDHPNVVRVFAVEANWREPYFTMEYAAGGTLADLVAPGRPLPDPAVAARLILTAAAGVAAAHAAGILHRDLKPSNILLAGDRGQETGDREQGTGDSKTAAAGSSLSPVPCPLSPDLSPASCPLSPKVSDFGLAKRTDRDDGLTRTGPIGTPGYMSPEAAAGRVRELAAAADVYGLGATLYFLLTGRPPFRGPDGADVIRRVVAEEPERPRTIRPEVPAELEAVVVRAMEKDPGRRYATVEGFADDLRRFLAGQKPDAPVLTWPRRAWRWLARNWKRAAAVVGVLLLTAGLVAAVVALTRPPDPVAQIRKDLAAGRAVTLIGETGLPEYHRFLMEPNTLGLAPDGTCTFHAFDYCLLELAPDPGIDRYRVSLKLRQLRPRPAEGKEQIDTDAVGFYFGHAAHRGPNGVAAHPCFAVTFQDYIPRGRPVGPQGPTRPVYFRKLGLYEAPAGRLLPYQSQGPRLTFTPPPEREGELLRRPPGEWRAIEADLAPDEVHIRWRADAEGEWQTLVRWTGERTRAEYEAMKAEVEKTVPGTRDAVPPWSPRMSLGVYSFRAAVAVRNVVVTPQP